MTDFTHLSDYILLAIFKLQKSALYMTLEGLNDHLLITSQSAVFYFFRKLEHKITISQFGATNPKLLTFHNVPLKFYLNRF